jgi:PGF-CTERM protein
MSKGSLKIGIAALIVLLMAMGTANALDSSTIQSADGDITIKLLDIKSDSTTSAVYRGITYNYTVEYNYGDTIKIRVQWANGSDSGYLRLLDVDNNFEIIETYTLPDNVGGDKTISIPSSTYAPATHFAIQVNITGTGYVDYLNTSDRDTIMDLNYKATLIKAEPVEPVISLTLKNPSNLIAKGDNIKISGTITTTEYNWTVKGPYNSSKFYRLARNTSVSGTPTVDPASDNASVNTPNHEIALTIPTHIILQQCEGTTGTYTVKVWNAQYPDTTASVDFTLVGLSISTSVDKDEVRLGESLKVFGTVNVAETESDYDNTTIGNNNVTIYIYNETGAEAPNLVTTYTVNVKSDDTFEKDIDFELTWDYGVTYEIKAKVTTGLAVGYSKADSAYVEVKAPEVKFVMDDVTFTRGEEDIKFKGTASLGAGSAVYVKEDDIDDFATGYTTVAVGGSEYIKALVGTDGTWETEAMDVKDDASIGSYTVHVYIFEPGTTTVLDEDTIKTSIVRQELDASIDKTSVAKGGKIKINGTTTVGTVYIFASEAGVFQGVTENPTESVYTIQAADMDVPVTDNEFTKTINVLTEGVDAGSYLLYVYAPSSTTTLRTAEDPQKIFSITVTEVGFIEYPDIVTMVRGQEAKLELAVPEGSKDDVYANFTFKGAGIKITPSEYSSFAEQLPDDDGIIELTLYPFWYKNTTQGLDKLEADYNTTTSWSMDDSTLLPVGVYTLEAELFYRETGEDIEKISIPVQVIAPELDVEVPVEVKLGDKLEITVKTNREAAYDGIYVVIGRALSPVWQKVTTDENGTAIAEFETLGLGLGTYTIYIRDTMRTIASGQTIDDFYDWDPTTEKEAWSKDDILVLKSVSVVQEVTVTPTPEETPTPVETTPEVTPTPVETTPEVTPTPVETTPEVVETTPAVEETTPEKPTPGFEAIFAIAGLLAVAYLLRRRT